MPVTQGECGGRRGRCAGNRMWVWGIVVVVILAIAAIPIYSHTTLASDQQRQDGLIAAQDKAVAVQQTKLDAIEKKVDEVLRLMQSRKDAP
jgi:hypothetical protein